MIVEGCQDAGVLSPMSDEDMASYRAFFEAADRWAVVWGCVVHERSVVHYKLKTRSNRGIIYVPPAECDVVSVCFYMPMGSSALCAIREQRGYITGSEARPMLMQTGLSTSDLKAIWSLADPVSFCSLTGFVFPPRNAGATPRAISMRQNKRQNQTFGHSQSCAD